MTKGTTSFGARGRTRNHIRCRRCGRHSYHLHKKRCSYCGFGATPKTRKYSWMHYH